MHALARSVAPCRSPALASLSRAPEAEIYPDYPRGAQGKGLRLIAPETNRRIRHRMSNLCTG